MRRALEQFVRDDSLTTKLAFMRACASTSSYVAYRRRQLPIYRVLEAELDAQVASDETTGLREFSSLSGAAGAVWRECDLRRAPALEAEIKQLSGRSFVIEDDLLPPAVRQYVRRIRAAATLNGDLLLGHLFARYGPELDATALGYKNHSREVPQVFDDVTNDLDDDTRLAILHEAARSFDLNLKVITEPQGNLYLGAIPGALRLAQARFFPRRD